MTSEEITNYISDKFDEFFTSISKNLVGYDRTSKALFISMLLNKHILFEGLPGVGKTAFVKLFSKLTNIDFKRVQCTPDLLPTDIVGGLIYDPNLKKFNVRYGPIFTNVLLLDELNRASPKTQSALLEAMEEKQVTIEGESYQLEPPFLVIATQNPIEQEGTYPLPEAQLDRFLFKLDISYPTKENEYQILKMKKNEIKAIFEKEDIVSLKSIVDYVFVSDEIMKYIVDIITTLRNNPEVSWGPSPRATISLLEISKICALLNKRTYVVPKDVQEFAINALTHRIGLKTEYELEGVNKETVIKDILAKVETI